MKKSRLFSILCFALTILFTNCSKIDEQPELNGSRLKASTGELTLSGSTWTGKVNGTTISTGTDLFTVANAVILKVSNDGGGTVNLRASGNSGSSGGALKYINLRNNVTFNGNNYTITGNSGDDLIVPIRSDRKSNVAVSNLKIAGRVRYGIWMSGCSGMNIQNCTSTAACLCPAFRFDNATSAASNLTIGTVSASGSTADQSMGVETYGINGVSISKVTATNMGGCGVLLNASTNCTVGTVNATKCCYGGGYAGFRTANSNGKTTVGTVTSTSCGRGFFSCTGSHDCTISTVNAYSCSDIGIWIQDSPNTIVKGGVVKGCKSCWAITGSSSGSKVTVSCQ